MGSTLETVVFYFLAAFIIAMSIMTVIFPVSQFDTSSFCMTRLT